MNYNAKCALAFIAGGIAGSIITALAMEKIRLMDEEAIDDEDLVEEEKSSDDLLNKKDLTELKELSLKNKNKPSVEDIIKSRNINEKEGYIDYSVQSEEKPKKEEKKKKSTKKKKEKETVEAPVAELVKPDSSKEESIEYPSKWPVIVSPEEFGMEDGYDIITFDYYTDGVLVDEDNKFVDGLDSYIGKEALKHFGEYDKDVVYVRNDKLKAYFEVLSHHYNYHDESES